MGNNPTLYEVSYIYMHRDQPNISGTDPRIPGRVFVWADDDKQASTRATAAIDKELSTKHGEKRYSFGVGSINEVSAAGRVVKYNNLEKTAEDDFPI